MESLIPRKYVDLASTEEVPVPVGLASALCDGSIADSGHWQVCRTSSPARQPIAVHSVAEQAFPDGSPARSGRRYCPKVHASASSVGGRRVGWLMLLPARGGEEVVRAREDPGYEAESRPALRCRENHAEEESARRP